MKKQRFKGLAVTAAPPQPTNRQMGNELVRVDAVYHLQELAPNSPGPWNVEAEKVAWIDPATGYGCIIRRSAVGGHLEGYVGVKPDHPLFGYGSSALCDLGLRIHGGINYAEPCLRSEPESRSICHVSRDERMRAEQARVYARAHDEMWWIGFACNQPSDITPKERAGDASYQILGTVEKVYRDEGYVLGQCRWLAEQLKAIGDGRDLSDVQERLIPPVGLNPHKAVH